MGIKRWTILAGALSICAAAFAAPVSAGTIYTIDPSQSFLTVAVQSQGVPLTLAQFLGSDTTSLGGTLDVTEGGGNITFNASPGSISFANQANPVSPGPGGGVASAGTVNALPDAPGTGTANYGLILIVPNDPGDPLNLDTGAILGYADIASALASLVGSSALAGGVFDTTGLTVNTDAGNLDYNLNNGNGDGPPQTSTPFIFGTTGIGGNSGAIAGAGNGSVVVAGGISTITIPVLVDVLVDTGLIVVDAIFQGQIVATAVVPEPSTFALAGLGLVALVPMARRRLRKS